MWRVGGKYKERKDEKTGGVPKSAPYKAWKYVLYERPSESGQWTKVFENFYVSFSVRCEGTDTEQGNPGLELEGGASSRGAAGVKRRTEPPDASRGGAAGAKRSKGPPDEAEAKKMFIKIVDHIAEKMKASFEVRSPGVPHGTDFCEILCASAC